MSFLPYLQDQDTLLSSLYASLKGIEQSIGVGVLLSIYCTKGSVLYNHSHEALS